MKEQKDNITPSPQEINDCIALLEKLTHNSEAFVQLPEDQRIALLTAAGRLSRPNREEDRKRQKYARKAKKQEIVTKDRSARATTGIRAARVDAIFKAPKQLSAGREEQETTERTLNSPRNCYICKAEYTRLHFFYDAFFTYFIQFVQGCSKFE